VADLVQAQDLDVYKNDDQPAHDVFLDALEDAKQDAPHIGTNFEIENTALSTFQPQLYKYKILNEFCLAYSLRNPFSCLLIHLLASYTLKIVQQ
jgi:hypothetical protein